MTDLLWQLFGLGLINGATSALVLVALVTAVVLRS